MKTLIKMSYNKFTISLKCTHLNVIFHLELLHVVNSPSCTFAAIITGHSSEYLIFLRIVVVGDQEYNMHSALITLAQAKIIIIT